MAASIVQSIMGVRGILSCAVHQRLLQHTPSATSVMRNNAPLSFIQVRYKKNKQRIKEAKVQADTSEKYIPKRKPKVLNPLEVNTEPKDKVEIMAEKPVDNVWIRKFYPPPQFSVEETIERHKAFAQPAMLNNMHGLLFLDMKLDLTTKKKTKFMANVRSTLRLPHEFPYGKPPNILVFCKTEDTINLATSLGAKHAGTPETITKLITTGVVNPKDFDHVLCTADCGNEVLSVRSYFREKFPQKAKGNFGPDLKEMWDLHYYGYTYETQKISDELGHLQVPLGLLEQPTTDLVQNFTAYITNICQQRSLALGPFIKSIKVVAPPSPEEFLVKVEDYVPGYKNEEVDSDEEEEAAKETA